MEFGFRQGKMTKTILSVCRGNLDAVSKQIWGCSSAGRAPALQAGGQEFDSPHLHQSEPRGKDRNIKYWLYLEN